MRSQFQSRQVMHSIALPEHGFASAGFAAGEFSLLRFVRGVDIVARPMDIAEKEGLGDAFTQNILMTGANPQTLRELIDATAAISIEGFALRKTFLIAEGAYARSQGIAGFNLNARLVLTWHKADESATNMMVSASPFPDDRDALLQLIAWSETDGAFHYFERRTGNWIWAGNSFLALESPSRGEGPFDSHVNGSLVMKELKAPWSHWHSMNNSIPMEVFPSDSAIANDPLFAAFNGAEDLEQITRFGVRRWTRSRIAKDIPGDGNLVNFASYLRRILWTTSVNLTSSKQSFVAPADPPFRLPMTFFIDADAFEFLAEALELADPLLPNDVLSVEEGLYRQSLAQWKIKLVEDAEVSPPDVFPGDTQFAFLVPERAFEDLAVLRELVSKRAIGARMALCLLAVDFTNPVFSERRAALLRHGMEAVTIGNDGQNFETRFITSVRSALAAGLSTDSPEGELISWFDNADVVDDLRRRIKTYFDVLRQHLATPQGAKELLELAASRRLMFSRRKLNEFASTLAHDEGARDHLALNEGAQLFVKLSDQGELLT